ncbi:MAG TPA: phage tail protein, partial [Hyphomicrobiaceae bacterium]|nr:phage tail protein [Hyphomicrobiaceae bacterium]
MADISFHHGTRVFESQETPVLLRTAQSAVVALIGTAPNADAAAFPLNTPVLLLGSTQLSKVEKLGDAGTLKKAVDGVFDQVGTYCYIIRVAEGVSLQATWSNLVGSAAALTGVHALKKCEGLFGRKLKPRLVAVPGYTSTTAADGIASVAVTAQGGGYTTVPSVTVTGGGGMGCEAKAIVESGAVTAVVVTKPGFGYTGAPVVTIAGGGGAGAT